MAGLRGIRRVLTIVGILIAIVFMCGMNLPLFRNPDGKEEKPRGVTNNHRVG